ncbi:MAG: hypothetical protein IPF74_15835 [Rhodocyclaceae bacterium]|nr:hypothetical protein [Rhodocyclaceae bacterium]
MPGQHPRRPQQRQHASRRQCWRRLENPGASAGTTANAVTEQSLEIGPGVMHLEVEFTGNTGQAVTVEAYCSEITAATTS